MAHQQSNNIYTPLAHDERQIRLLHLRHPQTSFLDEGYDAGGDTNNAFEIQCSFSVVSLDDDPYYDALSYVWGDASEICYIILDGTIIPVTANLHGALLQARHTTTTLWVDALCINQADLSERSSQVSLMHRIYSGASTVLISLGEAWSGCDIVMDFIELHGSNQKLHFNTVPGVNDLSFRSEAFQLSLLKFFYLPWWTRIWTVQEWGLAKHAVFLCGQRKLDGHHLQSFAQNSFAHDACCATNNLFSRSTADGRSVHAGLQKAALVRAQDVFQDWGYRGFIDVLATFQYRQCFNPCDKVFGLLGLAPESFQSKVVLDYNRSPEEVFTDVTLAAIAETGNLNVFSYIYGRRSGVLDLPSFIPDFTAAVQEEWVPNYLSRCFVTLDYYNTCSGSVPDLKMIDAGEATTSAIILDVVRETAPDLFNASWAHKLDDYRRLAELNASCISQGCRGMKTFWKTLCGGIYYDYKGASWFRPAADSDYWTYAKWQTWIDAGMPSELEDKDVLDFNRVFNTAVAGRKLIVTGGGLLGLAPWRACVGDIVAILPGGRVPYILRPQTMRRDSGFAEETLGRNQQYQFIGDAYVHGVMHGEAYDESELEAITLV
jgi:hypothetical protein